MALEEGSPRRAQTAEAGMRRSNSRLLQGLGTGAPSPSLSRSVIRAHGMLAGSH
jgi:hypothetical protein